MNIRLLKAFPTILCVILIVSFCCTSIGLAGIKESVVFESASVSIGSSVDADFYAGTNYNCSSIYVSSCILQKKNSSGTWTSVTTLTPPSYVAKNASNFGAMAYYSGSCTSGNTYRIRAVFKAVYNGSTYTVVRYSNSVQYN